MMDRKSIKPDLLSILPDNVIDEILMLCAQAFCPRNGDISGVDFPSWCLIQYLTRDKKVWRATKDLTSNFTTTIHNIIIHHPGPITKFVLCIQYWGRRPRIDNLLSFLSEKSIQHLVLRLPRRFKLPSSFFRHLLLQNCCLLLLPLDFKGFDGLISLELHGVTISSKFLESLISHCMLLEQLVLRSCDFMGDMATICLKCVPHLAKLSPRRYRKDWKEFDVANFLTSNFFESCSDLEHLHLDYSVKKLPNFTISGNSDDVQY